MPYPGTTSVSTLYTTVNDAGDCRERLGKGAGLAIVSPPNIDMTKPVRRSEAVAGGGWPVLPGQGSGKPLSAK